MAVGSKMPSFSVIDHDGNPINSADLLDRCERGIVIFSFPRCSTPGCTTQACGFRDNYDEYKKLGFEVYGISADNPTPQSNWRTKQGFQYTLLCDKPRVALKALGIDKGGVSIHRSHFVIAKDGTVLQSMIGISPRESIEKALEGAKAAAK
jgi:peroxiredoxin Q/BCP